MTRCIETSRKDATGLPGIWDATNRDNHGSADCGPSAFVEAAVEGRLPRGFGLKRLVDLPWPGRISGARSDSTRQHRRKETIRPCSFVVRRGLSPSIRNRIKSQGSTPKGRSKSTAVTRGKQQPWKRNLRPETFGETRQELAHVGVEGSAATNFWRGKLRKCRAIFGVRNHVVLRGLPGGG